MTRISQRPTYYRLLVSKYPEALQSLLFSTDIEPRLELEWESMFRRHVHLLNRVTHWKTLTFHIDSLAPLWPRIMHYLVDNLPWRLPSRNLHIITATHYLKGDGCWYQVEHKDWLGLFYYCFPRVVQFLGHITRLTFKCQTPIDNDWMLRFLAPFTGLKQLKLEIPMINHQLTQEIAQRWPGLISLRLKGNYLANPVEFAPSLGAFRNLTTLDLGLMVREGDQVDLRALNPTDYPHLRRLLLCAALTQEFQVRTPVILDGMSVGFLQFISRCWPQLKSLTLMRIYLDGQMADLLAKNAPNLRILRIMSCPSMGDLCTQWLSKCTNLRNLVLSFTDSEELERFVINGLYSETLTFLCIMTCYNIPDTSRLNIRLPNIVRVVYRNLINPQALYSNPANVEFLCMDSGL
ncbi:hypothetical protein H4R33_001561 [Dimargaris cristalligena]|nr:hypothetical protein H4R33_001561 [Dimargaris cristalligena]